MAFFKTPRLSAETVRNRLSGMVSYAEGVSGSIDSLVVSENGEIVLALNASRETLAEEEKRRYAVEQALAAMKGVTAVKVVLTSMKEEKAEPKGRKAALSGSLKAQGNPARGQGTPILNLPDVRDIIAVTSAKGGVGKSTVTVNLACALARKGLKVGVMDADIYGPSLPVMTGTTDAKPRYTEKKQLIPVEAHGLKLMSIGYVTDPDAAMIWRGPMVMSAITQMMKDVDWGELDLLILDTPPGTGDAQLTLAQKIKLSGAVIVSTPQEVALADVRRGVAMFRKTEIPILGLVENMAWFEDRVSGHRSYIFGEGGAQKLAGELDISVLGEVPIRNEIREGGDTGEPFAETNGNVFDEIAEGVLSALAERTMRPVPEIIFE